MDLIKFILQMFIENHFHCFHLLLRHCHSLGESVAIAQSTELVRPFASAACHSPAFLCCAGSSASVLVYTPLHSVKLAQYLEPVCCPGRRSGMGPAKFRLNFTIDLQPYSTGACTWFS